MTRLPPIQRFLADADLDRGPFGILGLTRDRCDDDAIAVALRRQLDRIARHPHGGTVEADEVRLTLHVAAAQLRDPAVRAELIEELATLRHRPAPPPPSATPSPARASPPSASSPPHSGFAPSPATRLSSSVFETTAMWVIAHSGGWNTEAQRRLWALAHASSVSPAELPGIIARVARRARMTAGASPHSHPAPAPTSGRLSPHSLPLSGEPEPLAAAARARDSLLRRWSLPAIIVALTLSSLFMLRAIAIIYQRDLAHRAAVASTSNGATPDSATPRDPDAERPSLDAPPRAEASGDSRRAGDGAAPSPSHSRRAPPADPARAATPPNREPLVPLEPAVEAWAAAARRAITPASEQSTAQERLLRALRFAMLNSAAEKQWLGDAEGAKRLIDSAERVAPPIFRPALTRPEQDNLLFMLTSPATGDDGRVARHFLLARRRDGGSLEALQRLRFRQEPLGPADCDVIAEVAFLGPGVELRSLARRFVDDQANSPIMLFSLLESVHLAPRTSSSAEVIEHATRRSLPRPNDPDWARAARAAILERLLEMLAVERIPGVDDLAQRLTEAYTESAGVPASPPAPSPAPPGDEGSQWTEPADPGFGAPPPTTTLPSETPPDPTAAARLLDLWRSRCDAYRASPEIADRQRILLQRREARLALASGPIQRFLAEQSTMVELAALAIGAERPSRASELRALVDAAADQRRSARHAFEQIEANERTLTRLWLVRFGAPVQMYGDTP